MQILRLHRRPGGQPLYVIVDKLGSLEQVVNDADEPRGTLISVSGYPILVSEQAPDIVDAISKDVPNEVRITSVVQS